MREYKEKDEVVKKDEIVIRNVDMPKLSFGIKINIKKIPIDNEYKLHMYISLLFNILFGVSSKFFEKMNNRKYLAMPLGIDKVVATNHLLVTLVCETNYPNKLVNEIKCELDNIKIDEEELNIYKKCMISDCIRSFDNIIDINDIIVSDVINYGKYINNTVDIIKKLNISEFNTVIKNIDFNNVSVYTVVPNNFQEKAG